MSDQKLKETVADNAADNAADNTAEPVAESVVDQSEPSVLNGEAPADELRVDLTGAPGSDDDDDDEPVIGLAAARRAVEAMLMVADQPVPTATIAQLLEMPEDAVNELCVEMASDFEALGHGFQLVVVAGGWRFQSHPSQAQYVERFVLDGQVSRLSAAALETLAIVAYKQPISRAQIAQIRGVNVDGVMRTLSQRGYVAEIGTDPGPGQASLFGTTTRFLEGVGMGSIADLSPLADFVPGAEIMEALEAGLRVDTVIDTSLDGPAEQPAEQPDEQPARPAPTANHDPVR